MRLISLMLLLGLTACAYPNVTLKQPPRAPVAPEQVQMLAQRPNSQMSEMAEVFAWSPLPVDGQAGYDRAVDSLRERAARIGATHLWVPSLEMVQSPGGRRWVWPDNMRDDDGHPVRPTELKGLAYRAQ